MKPFLALRSYLPADHPDKGKEIGSEATPAAFLSTLLALTREWRRLLAPHGSICVELGDTYSGDGGGDAALSYRMAINGERSKGGKTTRRERSSGWPLAKSLCLLPTLYPASLAYGRNLLNPDDRIDPWRVRNLIVWHRPNPPVGALGDKVRPSTSYITTACVSDKRWFDLDAERAAHQTDPAKYSGNGYSKGHPEGIPGNESMPGNPAGAPPLDCWTIPTQPYAGAHYACVDAETEALTECGWKRHDELQDGEYIAAYDAAAGVLRWEPATFHRYPFNGELVAINQRETVQRLTPNHRTLIRTRRAAERTIEAANLLPSHRLPLAAPFELDVQHGPSLAWAALCGWFVAEGHIPKQGNPRAVIYQSESANPHHVATIRDLLGKVNAEWTERRREREWRGRPSIEIEFRITGSAAAILLDIGKHIPAETLGWDGPALTAFMDALLDGDGHRRASGRCQFVTKHKADADMFQAIACRLGKRSTISERKAGGYSVTVGERAWVSLRGANGAHNPIEREHYEGTVWCPSVPSTYWLARRDGRPFITGNTFPIALPRRLIRLMCPMHVCRVCGEARRRIVETEYIDAKGRTHEPQKWASGVNGGQGAHSLKPDSGITAVRLERDWTDCGCPCPHPSGACLQDPCCRYRRGHVLDPFAGSGTTLAAATEQGRDATGIDLDERNVDLARERVGLFLEEVA